MTEKKVKMIRRFLDHGTQIVIEHNPEITRAGKSKINDRTKAKRVFTPDFFKAAFTVTVSDNHW